MVFYLLSHLIRIVFGTLYPAYYSFKAVKTKNPKEYVHWMMYWIVFGFYSVFETFADAFFGGWFPFYYEIKIIFQLWILSSTTRGSGTLYKRIVHPNLTKYENDIDNFLEDIQGKMKDGITNCGTLALSHMSESLVRVILRIQQGVMKTATAVNYHTGGGSRNMGNDENDMIVSLSKMSPTTPDFDTFHEDPSFSTTGFFLGNPQRTSSRKSIVVKKEDIREENVSHDDVADMETEEITTGTDDTENTDESSSPEYFANFPSGKENSLKLPTIKPSAAIRRERRSKKKINPGGNSSSFPAGQPIMSLRNRHTAKQT